MKSMKTTPRVDGQRRIFNKALQSAFGSPSLSQKDNVASKEKCKRAETKTTSAPRPNTNTPKSTEVTAASFEYPIQTAANGPVACKRADAKTTLVPRANPHTPKSTEVIAASLENPIQMETYGPECSFSPNSVIEAISYDTATNSDNYVQMDVNNNDYTLPADYFTETSPSDAYFWMKDNNLDLVKETLDMVPNNEIDPWIINNRLMALQKLDTSFNINTDPWIINNRLKALQQLEMVPNDRDAWITNNRQMALQQLETNSPGQYPPYWTHSTGEISPISAYNPSDSGVFTISPLSSRNSLSPESFSLKEDVPLSNVKCTFERHDRPIIYKEAMQEGITLELIQSRNFIKNQNFSEGNSVFSEVKSACKIDDRGEFVCENANHSVYKELYLLKEASPKNLNHVSSDEDCCETFHDKPVLKNKYNVAKLPSYNVASLMNFKSRTGFFDSHCHIDFLFGREKLQGTYADYMAEHRDSYPESYKGCIAVFCKPFTFAKERIWRKHLEQDKVWGAFGCHPRSAKFYDAKIEEDLENALDHPKVKALGEIGLDYSKGNKCSKLEQHHVFRRQLRIAKKRKLRVVIHCRDADDDTIKIMHEILPKDTIFHLHCFTGSWERAQKWIEEFPNVFIGITNLVTFPSATETHEVARQLPLDRLLLETDAPYFVPLVAPKGTNSSHPGMAVHVAAQIAALKNIPMEDVLNWTSANTRIVYNITEN